MTIVLEEVLRMATWRMVGAGDSMQQGALSDVSEKLAVGPGARTLCASHESESEVKAQSHFHKSNDSKDIQYFLSEAIQHYHARRFTQAARLCEQILTINSNHADSLQLLGMIAHQTQMIDLAIYLLQKAISNNPKSAIYRSNLGTVFQSKGMLEEAREQYMLALEIEPRMAQTIANLGAVMLSQGHIVNAVNHYKRAIEIRPDIAELYLHLGNALNINGQCEDAIKCFRKSLDIKPNYAEAYCNIAHVLASMSLLDEAITNFKQAIAIDSRLAHAHNGLGAARQAQQEYAESVKHYEMAIALNPGYVDAYCNLGNVLVLLKQFDKAVAHLTRAIELNSAHDNAYNGLGNALIGLDRVEDAISCFRLAISRNPRSIEAHINLAGALHKTEKLDEATQSLQKALSFQPENVAAHVNLGNIFVSQDHLDAATNEFKQAIRFNPDCAAAHMSLGLIQLLRGEFSSGWGNYEWRWRIDDLPLGRRNFAQPQWNGENLSGKRILLHSEQGLGDSIQFLRYVWLVHAAGGEVVLEVPSRLRRLAVELPCAKEVISYGETLPDLDYHCPLLSLPLVFKTTLETIPAEIPYISVPKDARQKANTLSWPSKGLRIGLAWNGNREFISERARRRSIAFSLLKPLLEVRDVHLFSLQIGEAVKDLSMAPGTLTDLSSYVTDMADTAAQISHLDLVISIDTSVAHLAGALGVETWLLLPYRADWRWLLSREDSPWYPTMRLFRQSQLGDWEAVIQKVCTEIRSAHQM